MHVCLPTRYLNSDVIRGVVIAEEHIYKPIIQTNCTAAERQSQGYNSRGWVGLGEERRRNPGEFFTDSNVQFPIEIYAF